MKKSPNPKKNSKASTKVELNNMTTNVKVRKEFYDKILDTFTVENGEDNLPVNFSHLQKELFLSAVKNLFVNYKKEWFNIILKDILESLYFSFHQEDKRDNISIIKTIAFESKGNDTTKEIKFNVEITYDGSYYFYRVLTKDRVEYSNLKSMVIEDISCCLINILDKTTINFDSFVCLFRCNYKGFPQ